MCSNKLSPDEIRQWREDGVVCLRGVFDQGWMDILETGFENACRNQVPLQRITQKTAKEVFLQIMACIAGSRSCTTLFSRSPVAELAAGLMGADAVNLIDDHLLLKEPGTDNPTYWHQDQPYFNFAGEDFVSLWIPIDPVDENNGTMRFVKGSHLWGKQFHPVRIGLGEVVEEAEDFDGLAPDIDGHQDRYDVLSWSLSPGDCFAFHGKMLHAAFANSTVHKRRRAFSLRLTGDDIVWHLNSYAPTETKLPNLVQGGPITCDEYPKIWP